MKLKYLLGVFLAFIATAGFSQQTPINILALFRAKYPDQAVKTIKFKHDVYTISFIKDEKKCSAFFDAKGNWQKTETEYRWKDMPTEIKVSFVRSEYGNWLVEDSKKVESSYEVVYSVEVDNQYVLDREHAIGGEKDYFLIFSPDGKIVRVIPL